MDVAWAVWKSWGNWWEQSVAALPVTMCSWWQHYTGVMHSRCSTLQTTSLPVCIPYTVICTLDLPCYRVMSSISFTRCVFPWSRKGSASTSWDKNGELRVRKSRTAVGDCLFREQKLWVQVDGGWKVIFDSFWVGYVEIEALCAGYPGHFVTTVVSK